MSAAKRNRQAAARERRLAEAIEVLFALKFGPKQRNETAAYTLLALLDLQPDAAWADAQAPLRGITPVIHFIASAYGVRYAPNTRETIRDDAVKFFVEEGLLLRNPDDPNRPTNSGKTVYQIEPTALALLRKVGTPDWARAVRRYLASLRCDRLRADRSPPPAERKGSNFGANRARECAETTALGSPGVDRRLSRSSRRSARTQAPGQAGIAKWECTPFMALWAAASDCLGVIE